MKSAVRLYVRPEMRTGAALQWEAVTSSSHAVSHTDVTLQSFLAGALPGDGVELVSVKLQGITPPLDAPVAILHAHLRGPDMFLHCVCIVRDTHG